LQHLRLEFEELPVVGKIDPVVEHVAAHSFLLFRPMSKEVENVEKVIGVSHTARDRRGRTWKEDREQTVLSFELKGRPVRFGVLLRMEG
jgi:hypothetical protein